MRESGEHVDLETMKQLMELVDGHGLAELEIHDTQNGIRVLLRKPVDTYTMEFVSTSVAPPVLAATADDVAVQRTEPPRAGHEVTSPMTGSFFRAPSPEAGPFVQVGDSRTSRYGHVHRRGDEGDE
jgi:acetyl-CoA carboxylase biotin carboxyl carrier protein